MKQLPLDKQISEDEFNSQKSYFLNSEFQVELEFNKSLLSLSAGGLVLSVTIMQIFVDSSSLIHLCLLWVAWGLLLIATVLSLFFYKIVQKSIHRKHEHLEHMYHTKPPERYDELFKKMQEKGIKESLGLIKWYEKANQKFKSVIESVINSYSSITTVFFISGIIVLIFFVYLNLQNT